MQVWESTYMFVFMEKQYTENFAFFFLRFIELFTGEVCKSLRKQANFYHILLYLNVCKQTFHIPHVGISQKSLYLFILIDCLFI